MTFFSIIKAASLGDVKRVRPMILWTILEYLLRGAPYGILLGVIWELFRPLENPGMLLNYQALIALCVALLVSLALLYWVSKKAYDKIYWGTYEICAEGRLAIGDHLRKLSMGFFDARDPGVVGSYLLNDYANVEFLLSHLVPQIIGGIAMPVVLIIMLAFMNWKLAIITTLVIPLSIPFTYLSRAFIRYFGKKQSKAKIDAASRMLEYIQGMRLIKAFNLTGTKFDRLEKSFRTLKSLSIKLEAGGGPTVLLSSFVLHSGLTIIILFGLSLLFSNEISLPVYLTFLILGSRVYEPLIQALTYIAEINYYQISVNRLEDLRNTPGMTGSKPDLHPGHFDISFDDVSFQYQKTTVLKNINLKILERSLTAFVGPSGSGKTTITRLIARFWDVTAGSIKLDNHDLREYDPDTILNSISMVFQDVYLFNDTVINNIRIGKKNASMEEVYEAAKQARCHEFIMQLPDGYQTMVGEGGCTLSGGEKQRISIARAILKNSPIVLLDEATASLDPENELYIQEAIDRLVKNRTVVVIAHRLNTIVHADNIVVLDEGTIVEQGTHKELMQENGLFKRMWDEQQKVRQWKFNKVISPDYRKEYSQ
jgi:ATP-binding cassette subfamily B protein IrtB